MVKHAPILLAWLSWALAFAGWVIMLAGAGSLQSNCGSSNVSRVGFGVDYMAPVSCDKIYRYAWWTTWYQFFMVVLVPVILAMGIVHKFRLGLVGLLIPLCMLLMATANNFYMLWSVKIGQVTGGLSTRSKDMFAGSIISAVANFFLIILVGVHDEKVLPMRAPTG